MSKPCHFFFQNKNKNKSSLSINQICWKNLNINNISIVFIVCILALYASWFSYYWNMVTILTSSAFIGAALIRGEVIISMWITKGAALTRGQRLLEEIQYIQTHIKMHIYTYIHICMHMYIWANIHSKKICPFCNKFLNWCYKLCPPHVGIKLYIYD